MFEALSPDDTNKLAFEIVQTLQGESGNVESLLARTSSLTNTLAGRDQLIGDVVTNLSEVLDTIGTRDAELRPTIDTLTAFVSGLKKDRNAILNSLDSISGLTEETADLLVKGRPDIRPDIKQLNRLTKNLSKTDNLNQIEDSLQILPIKLSKVSNLASNGSLFNFYVCELKVSFSRTVPEQLQQSLPSGSLLMTASGVGAARRIALRNRPEGVPNRETLPRTQHHDHRRDRLRHHRAAAAGVLPRRQAADHRRR